MTSAEEFSECRSLCESFLRDAVDQDWSSAIPGLELNIGQVVAHMARTTLWYATDLAAGGVELEPVEQSVDAEAPPAQLVDTLVTYGRILDAVVRTSAPEARGFHPFGQPDPSGFAGMGCDEWLVHTHDIARGLGREFEPPDELCTALLIRIFPWADVDAGHDPWQLLQWANGRIPLGDLPQLTRWRWHCAPLDEWDGLIPEGTQPPLS